MTSEIEAGNRVWDLPTRLFHWALVIVVASAWASAYYADTLRDVTMRWHRWNGYGLLVLLVWRLLWGFAGSPASRFANFLASPLTALRYGLDTVLGRSRRFLGHNPLGGWMVVALLVALAAQAVLGLFTIEHDDLANGPLAGLIADGWAKPIRRWHHFMFEQVILWLVGLHLVANLLYAVVKREPLVRAMITGSKPPGAYEDAGRIGSPPSAMALRALLCLVIAAGLVFGSILAAGGRL
jgi:cytochrome b